MSNITFISYNRIAIDVVFIIIYFLLNTGCFPELQNSTVNYPLDYREKQLCRRSIDCGGDA